MPPSRRRFVVGLTAAILTASHSLHAQRPARVYRVGVLRPTAEGGSEAMTPGLQGALRELGYVDGQNLALDVRFADNKLESAPRSRAGGLSASKVDVIVAVGAAAVRFGEGRYYDGPDRVLRQLRSGQGWASSRALRSLAAT